MTDPDDLMLASLFLEAEDDQIGVSGPVFTQHVMVRVNEAHAKRKALLDSLLLAVVACAAVICIVFTPSAWPQIEAALIRSTSAFGVGEGSLALIGVLLLSGLGWAVAVRD